MVFRRLFSNRKQMEDETPRTTTPAHREDAREMDQSSQDPVEIDSDKENRPGLLRGINPSNVLTPTPTQHTTELDHDITIVGHKYGTRTAKNGRASGTSDTYDMKVSAYK